MAAFVKFNQFVQDVASGVHQMQTGSAHVFKVLLTNTAPVATNTVRANLTELGAGNGYTTGGNTCSLTSSTQSGGTYKLVLASPAIWTAAGAGFNFRYAILWNATTNQPVGAWDYGSTQTVNVGETVTVILDGTNGVFQAT